MSVKFIDLFCGVGGFRYAAEAAFEKCATSGRCVFSSDIDKDCQNVYQKNFGERPHGDITQISPSSIPEFDLLLGGFPCQPFSIIGKGKGFEDTRGTLFFSIANILNEKRPAAFVLENVKQLKGHNNGKTLNRIMYVLSELGYYVSWHIYNAIDFGLPQNRERIFIVGFKNPTDFIWPNEKQPMIPLSNILEKEVSPSFYVSAHIRAKRLSQVENPDSTPSPSIWHENKSGHVSVYPYSCALRAGSSYNYLLVDGIRRLTGREMFRLQGFPEKFKLADSYTIARRQAGNSLPVPVAEAVITNVIFALQKKKVREFHTVTHENSQLCFAETTDIQFGKDK